MPKRKKISFIINDGSIPFPITFCLFMMYPTRTKYLHIEYRAVSGVFRTTDPPSPLHPASVSSPAPKAGSTHSPGGEGVEGSIVVQKTPDIGLASYSRIPLRLQVCSADVQRTITKVYVQQDFYLVLERHELLTMLKTG